MRLSPRRMIFIFANRFMSISNIISKLKGYDPLPASLLKEYNRHRPLGPQPVVCYAPFRSIYFGHYGKAVACCFNRNYVLGEYPKQSIREIWFGEAAEKLRKYVKHSDLSLGCYGCKSQLTAQNFDAVKAKQYDERKSNENRFPSVMEFELSNVCNLECEMCNGDFSSLIRAKREKLPPIVSAYDDNFVKQLEEFIPYLEEVKFYGGEPFLIDIYYKIWDKLVEINPKVRVSVQTNATTLNSRVKELMEHIDFHINVSFDSLIKPVYETIRKNADYDRVIENILYFQQYCKARNTFFGISVCAMQQNWRELPDFINFCNNLEVPVYFHTVDNPPHCAIRNLSAEEIDSIIHYLGGFDFPSETNVQKKNRTHYFDFYNQIKAWQLRSGKIAPFLKERSMANLKEVLRVHIQSNKFLNEDEKHKSVTTVIRKVEQLEQSVSQDVTQQVLNRLDVSDEQLDDMIKYISKMPAPALIAMAKTLLK
ncbi:MAG: radical SAM protein [Chitinophagales bacterium]|nr:radical SAM protein [Chitinophagales bacterium]